MERIPKSEQLEQKRIYWKQQIESWQETGLSQAEYCRRHHLKHHQMVYWKKRFVQIESGVSFVPLKINGLSDISGRPECDTLCLVIDNRFKIEIEHGFDVSLLRQLILALRAMA